MKGKERDKQVATEMWKERKRLASYKRRLTGCRGVLRDKKSELKDRNMARLHRDYLEKHMDTVREDMRQR